MSYAPPGGLASDPETLEYWDASRAAIAAACWRKHWLANIRGLRLKGVPNVHLTWGKAYHACTEYFDNGIAAGLPREDTALATLQIAMQVSWDAARGQPFWGEWFQLERCTDPAERPHKRNAGQMVPKSGSERCPWSKTWQESVPARLPQGVCAACGHLIEYSRKWLPEHRKKTRANLLRAVALYCDQEGLAPYAFEDRSEPVTEVQHRIPLGIHAADGTEYKLVVNIDSIVDHHGWPAIRERKTTGMAKLDHRFWGPYEMNPQVDSYDLAARVIYAVEDRPPKLLLEVTRVTEGGEVEIVRHLVNIPEGRADEWLGELRGLILEAEMRTATAAQAGPEVAFPRNTTACHGKFSTCAFWRLCTAAPHEREQVIADDYKVEHWDPLSAETITASEDE